MFSTYLYVDFFGNHRRNIHNKNDTNNIESVNSDLRHHISGLIRKSKTFYRCKETFRAVLAVFINSYNKYYKEKNILRRSCCLIVLPHKMEKGCRFCSFECAADMSVDQLHDLG